MGHEPSKSASVFDKWKKRIPNFSMRMSNLAACVLRPQLRGMTARGEKWNQIYRWLEQGLNRIDGIEVPHRQPHEAFVASSIQFHANGLDKAQLQTLADKCTQRGGGDQMVRSRGAGRLYQSISSLEIPATPGIAQHFGDFGDHL